MMQATVSRKTATWLATLLMGVALTACSSYKPPKPTPLQQNPASVPAVTSWTQKLAGNVHFPLLVSAEGGQVVLGSSNGQVQALQASSGASLWQAQAGKSLSAGVGTDGTTTAVVVDNNMLVALRNGQEVWRTRLASQAYTAPLVAGGRVFVLTADRGITSYDAANGYRLWQQTARGNSADRMVLEQSSLLMPAGGMLLAGVSGRVVVFNPDNGTGMLEMVLASPRGIHQVASMADVIAPATRADTSLCARSFQAAVGCVDMTNGSTVWTQPSDGATGVTGDAGIVIGTDRTGDVIAWNRQNGDQLWQNRNLRYRNLSAPLLVGNLVVVGDGDGMVHILDRNTGLLRNRIATDGSAIQTAPVLAGNTVVVVTSRGTVTGIRLN